MSIFYGLLTVIFMGATFLMFSEGRMGGMGSIFLMQFLLPGIMILFGFILIGISRPLAATLANGLEDESHTG
jgi:hypothetical protein